MGLRGPASKPTALRVYEGKRAHRPLPSGEPTPRAGVPPIPDELPPLGQEAWKRAVAVMRDIPGWLTTADWAVLARWALDYAIWRDCVAAVKDHGLTYEEAFVDSSGQEYHKPRPRPELRTLNEAAVRMAKAEQALGFAPAYRARISLDTPGRNEDDDLDAT